MDINTFIFTHKGNKSVKCKDICRIATSDNCYVVALSDGVSTQEYSDIGATEVQKAIEIMLKKEENLIAMSDKEIQFKLVKTIRKTMDNLAKMNLCNEAKFASTLMLLIVIPNADFFWTVHLGDGMIGMVDEKGEIKVLSAEQNGIMRNFTYTTASYDLLKRVRVKKNKIKEGDVFLITDGIENEIRKNKMSRDKYVELIKDRNWIKFKRELIRAETEDDIGFCGVSFREN